MSDDLEAVVEVSRATNNSWKVLHGQYQPIPRVWNSSQEVSRANSAFWKMLKRLWSIWTFWRRGFFSMLTWILPCVRDMWVGKASLSLARVKSGRVSQQFFLITEICSGNSADFLALNNENWSDMSVDFIALIVKCWLACPKTRFF